MADKHQTPNTQTTNTRVSKCEISPAGVPLASLVFECVVSQTREVERLGLRLHSVDGRLVEVEHHEGVAGLQQVVRHVPAHVAQTHETYRGALRSYNCTHAQHARTHEATREQHRGQW